MACATPKIEITGDQLTITCTLPKEGSPSKSGATLLLSSTRGESKIERPGQEPLFINLNAYTKK